jgi:hypothetical protein
MIESVETLVKSQKDLNVEALVDALIIRYADRIGNCNLHLKVRRSIQLWLKSI